MNAYWELIQDGKRWRALNLATGVGGLACASCEMVNDETEIDAMTCAVVPWDVMGDSRSFAFVCDSCAAAVNKYDARDDVDGHGFTFFRGAWFHCGEYVLGSVTGDSFAECRECDAVIEWSELTGVES